ncbi:MAG TPA: AMP-binding protein [Gammaproteobacteria bacterium]|nr:AMP-binding protein [Gammaproteobacteria bacterium]
MADHNLHTAAKFGAIARVIPDSPCFIQGRRRLTYGEVDARTNALANAFLEGGIARGDRVAVMERNSPEYMESYLAAQKLACVPLNVNYKYQGDELRYVLDDSGASVIVIHADFLPVLDAIRGRVPGLKQVVVIGPDAHADPGQGRYSYARALQHRETLELPWEPPGNDDLLFLLYTGGTTGYPKGVMWDVQLYRENWRILAPMFKSLLPRLKDAPPSLFSPRGGGSSSPLLRFLQSGLFRWLIAKPAVQRFAGNLLEKSMRERYAGDLETVAKKAKAARGMPNVTLPACPLMHGTGFLTTLNAISGGEPVVFLEDKRFDPAELWRTIERERVRTVVIVGDAFAVPMLEELDRHDYDTSSLVMMNSSGVVWSPRIKQALLERIPQMIVVDSLGASEGLSRSEPSLSSDGEIQPMRFRLAGHMKVFDENDEEVLPGSDRVGQLAVSGLIPRGYWNDPEKTARTFRTIRGVRYAIFGDMCRVESDGTLILLGRGSGCINTGGEKVYPEEVENVIKELPEVGDCAIVGIDDERWGQAISGLVAPAEGREVDVERVIAHCAEKLANYKKPKSLFVVDEIPRKDSGKLIYPDIREKVRQLAKRSA